MEDDLKVEVIPTFEEDELMDAKDLMVDAREHVVSMTVERL
jgi:hypothetical protein